MPYPEWEVLSGSAFLVSLTALKKQSFNEKSVFKSDDQVSNSQTIKRFATFLCFYE